MWIVGTTCLVAALVAGFAIGWPTGLAGLDSVVLAAVLPAILTGVAGGAGALVLHRLKGTDVQADKFLIGVTSGSVALFAGSFILGTFMGNYSNELASVKQVKQVEDATEKILRVRYEYIRRCTEQFVRINRIREEASSNDEGPKLEPLKLSHVCIAVEGNRAERSPVASIFAGKNVIYLSTELEQAHYEYVEECTLSQGLDYFKRVARQQSPGTIEDVCPDLGAKYWEVAS